MDAGAPSPAAVLATFVAAAAATALFFVRRRLRTTSNEAVPAAEPAAEPAKRKPKRKPKRKGEAAAAEPLEDDSELESRPVLPEGSRVWHTVSQEECTVAKVYYDDIVPYYTVRMRDGSERSTVRARLQSLEERDAAAAEAARRAASERADAIAAELLAEEARAPKGASRRPSQGKAKNGSSR